MKIRPVGAELFHTDGWTDMKMMIVAFRKFANSRKTICLMSRFRFWRQWRYSLKNR